MNVILNVRGSKGKALSEELKKKKKKKKPKCGRRVLFWFGLPFFPLLAKPFCVGHSFIFVFSEHRYPETLQFSAFDSSVFGSDDEKLTNLNWASSS